MTSFARLALRRSQLATKFHICPTTCIWSRRIPNMAEETISGVHVSAGNADTLLRRDVITNHHSIVYTLSNISTKITKIGWCALKLIVCNRSVSFFETHSIYVYTLQMITLNGPFLRHPVVFLRDFWKRLDKSLSVLVHRILCKTVDRYLMTTWGQAADDNSQQQQRNKLHPTTNTAAEMITRNHRQCRRSIEHIITAHSFSTYYLCPYRAYRFR